MRRLGAIAQLGERRHGMAEVEGSSPSSSIVPDGGRTGGMRKVGSITSRASMRDFLGQFLKDELDAHRRAVV
jgi:hypothetical protein